jgi:uncharacterized metal-binding protein YceD (DUF177 family)
MADEIDWHVPVTVSDLPPDGADFELAPEESVRAMLAERAGVVAVPSLMARLHVQPEGKAGVAVDGTLAATVRQVCVVTLEPFDNRIDEKIALRFVPAESMAVELPHVIEAGAEEPPEPLVDGKLDLASVVAEFLTLSVDPYPRKPGAVFSPPGDGDGEKESSAFAALAKLKLDKDVKKQ